ncbi:MAG: SLC13 family permease, partial [Tannerellaceae bacterium]
LTIATFVFFKKGEHIELQVEEPEDDYIPEIPKRARYFILIVGVLSLALVPVFQSLTSLPPFLGIMLGLVILWFYTDIMYSRLHGIEESQKLRIATLLTSVDLGTILFFTGILMAVGALETSGQLGLFANFLDTNVHQPYIISFVIGLMSSVVDNVALVAATIGMYPIADPATGLTEYVSHFVRDGGFWTFLAYCAVTGGSILIIGSATGVTVMGLEKINFMYYTKKFTLLALLGYVSGALAYLAMFS